MKNVFYSALPLKLGDCASYEEFGMPIYSKKDPFEKRPTRGKRGIKVTGALRSAGFQKIPAGPQIVLNRFSCLNMLV